MKISYKWLQDYVSTTTPPEKLAEKFLLTSSEVEEQVNWKERLKGLVVGEVEKIENHPQADRLRVAQVNIGTARKTIVCGAANLALGQKVVVALPNTTIHPKNGTPLTLRETAIRGITSEGMLCAAEEIGLSLPSDGILVLEDTLKPGTPFGEAWELDDYVLDLEITPNRPDLLSYMGLAREVSTFEKRTLQEPEVFRLNDEPHQSEVAIAVESSKLCPRYSAICLENIRITTSPRWLQSRLLLSGIRPINSVVDVTNYVMLETGQPLHAFDQDTVAGGIQIRGAKPGETVVTLDAVERTLEEEDIVIANNNTVLAIGGIMGSQYAEISPSTTRIILESANFSGKHIRRTSRRLGLRSEASTRFEKGLDPELTVTALKRAIFLLQQISEATVSSPIIDIYAKSRAERTKIHLNFAQIQQILGVHISAAEAKTILHHLGFQIPALTKSYIEVIPPSWRADVLLPEDVLEELIRIWGYDRLPSTTPTGQIKAPYPNSRFRDKQITRRILASLGLHEAVHLSFTSENALQKIGLSSAEAVPLALPLSQETEYLVPTHLIHFLENIASTNIRQTDLGLFEIGRVFSSPHNEKELLSIILRSNNELEHLYRKMKTTLNHLAHALQLSDSADVTQPADSQLPYYAPETTLGITMQGKVVGEVGQIKPSIVSQYKIRSGQNILFAYLDLESISQLQKKRSLYTALSQFPSIERDITLVVAKELPAQAVQDVLKRVHSSPLLQSWEITNIYTGKPLPDNKKSITLHFVYNAFDRTLEDSEVNADQQQLSTLFVESLNAEIK